MWSGLYFLTGRTTITRVRSCGPLLPRQTGPVVWLPPPPPGALTWVTEECGPGETVGVGRLTFPRTRSQDSPWVTTLRLGQDQVYDACVQLSHELFPAVNSRRVRHYHCSMNRTLLSRDAVSVWAASWVDIRGTWTHLSWASVLLWYLLRPRRF